MRPIYDHLYYLNTLPGKSLTHIEHYLGSSEQQEESSRKPVVDNKIFHPSTQVLTEAIQDVSVQVYEVYQPASPDGGRSEGDNFIIHCPLDLMDALSNQIDFRNSQSSESNEYSITIREYRERSKNPQNNECLIDIDETFKTRCPIASLFFIC